MALKATGAYRHCKPCGGAPEDGRRHHHGDYACSEAASGSDWRTGGSAAWTPRTATSPMMGRELKEISSGERTPSVSGWTEASSAAASTFPEDGEEEEPKEWVAQVEPGILITFLSLPHGGNDLKRIRFRYSVSVLISFLFIIDTVAPNKPFAQSTNSALNLFFQD